MSQQYPIRDAWPHILLVEDDPEDTDRISAAIAGHFCTSSITPVDSGMQAFETDITSFDAVLLNSDLPDCTGLAVLEHIIRQRDMPVLMVTRRCDDESAVTAIRSGACDYVVKQGGYLAVLPVMIEKALVMGELKSQNQHLQEQLRERNQQLQEVNERLEDSNKLLREIADRDPLTGLSNRRHFDNLLAQRCAEARRYKHDLACMMIDVDDFKQINDSLGHQAGDQVLILAASVLRTQLRAADIPARYGGDEFVVLLPHSTALDACALARRIARRFEQEVARMVPDPLQSSVSIGIEAVPGSSVSRGPQLVRAADKALLKAKQSGKGRVVLGTVPSVVKTA